MGADPTQHPDLAAAVKIVMQVPRALWYIHNIKHTAIIPNIFTSWFLILARPFQFTNLLSSQEKVQHFLPK